MKHRRRPVRLLVALAGAALLAGCASPADGGGTGDQPDPDAPVSDQDHTPTPSSSEQPDVSPTGEPTRLPADLTIVLDETGEGSTRTFTLTCEPTGGDHPDPEAACTALWLAGVEAFEPTPRDVACTEVWGGPQVATVEGTVDGGTVRASFSRTNGCEISRWDALAPLLGSTGGLL